MNRDQVQAVLRDASELASALAPEFRVAAFSVAAQLLVQSPAALRPLRPAGKSPSQPARVGGAADDSVGAFNQIDASAFPQVHDGKSVLQRGLWVVRIGREELALDGGMTAESVGRVLSEKFRIRTTTASVRMAFDRAPKLVDRVRSEGGAAHYRIMAAGDGYLEQQRSDKVDPDARS